MRKKSRGFTLMELLVVMVLLGILVALGLTNFRGSQAKSRDSRRKSELRQIALTMETYFNDKGKYPDDDGAGHIMACAPDDVTKCDWGTEWKDSKGTVYMIMLPADPGNYVYYYDALGATNGSYQLYARLENTLDSDVTKDGSGNPEAYTGLSCGAKLCNYGIASTNINAGTGRTLAVE